MKLKKQLQMGALSLAVAVSLPALAAGTAAEEVTVMDPYVRAVPPGQPNSAAFMTLKNSGDQEYAVVSGSSPAAKVVELHTHVHQDGMMMMRQIERIDLPGGEETVLEPGGLHVMLIGLRSELVPDETVQVTLEFNDGSTTTIDAPIRKVTGMGGMMKKKGMQGGGMMQH